MARRLSICALATLFILGCGEDAPGPSASAPPKPPSPNTATPAPSAMPSTPSEAASSPPSTTPMAAAHGTRRASAPTAANDSDEGKATFGPFVATLPDGWKSVRPASSMRLAQFQLPGAENPQLAITHFGRQGAGGLDANLRRWASQFDGDPEELFKQARIEEKTFGAFKGVVFDLAGTFKGSGMAMHGARSTPKANQRMLAAIVQTDGGPYYFKAVGPESAMAAQVEAFEAFLGSLAKP